MRALGLLVVAACAAQPAPGPKSNADAVTSASPRPRTTTAHADRPQIDIERYLPDFSEDLRWPLTAMAHPKLEPTYAVATALAAPGIGWLDLCSVGAQSRRLSGNQELVEYLHGWCAIAKGDVDGACRYLRPLLGSMKLRDAVQTDLANILADQGDADKAEHWINKHHIVDIQVLDRLAANFVEIGQERDAVAINQHVIDADSAPSAATKCRRLTRQIVLRDGDWRAKHELEELVTQAKAPDPTCVRLERMVKCSRDPATGCDLYFLYEHVDRKVREIIVTYAHWPYNAHYEKWWITGKNMIDLIPLEGADELAVTALEAAFRANNEQCTYDLANSLQAARSAITSAALHARVDAVLGHCVH